MSRPLELQELVDHAPEPAERVTAIDVVEHEPPPGIAGHQPELDDTAEGPCTCDHCLTVGPWR
jgi:hypothetical protein